MALDDYQSIIDQIIQFDTYRMVLTLDGKALDDYPSSVNQLVQHNLHLKENSARLTAEKTQVMEMLQPSGLNVSSMEFTVHFKILSCQN